MNSLLKKTILSLLILASFASFAKDSAVYDWPAPYESRISADFRENFGDKIEKLAEALFDSLNGLMKYTYTIPTVGFKVGFKIKRKVFSNHSITDSYTVVDTFQLPFEFPLPTSVSVPVGPVMFSAGISAKIKIDTINIRQVMPKNIKTLPGLKKIKESSVNILKFNPKKIKVPRLRKVLGWRKSKPGVHARWSKIFNLITHPFRMPLTVKAAKRMKKGEISAWAFEGTLQLSGSVGWGITQSPVPNVNLSFGVGVKLTTYLTGRFQISVLKENNRFYRIKATRKKSTGVVTTIGDMTASDYKKQIEYTGLLVFDSVGTSIFPFEFKTRAELSDMFDVGYRYDFALKKGREAYKHAVLGRFKKSEEYAKKDWGVKKIFTRRTKAQSVTKNRSFNLAYLVKLSSKKEVRVENVLISLPNGTRHIFRGINSYTKKYVTLFGPKERKSFIFTTTIDRDLYNMGKEGGAILQIDRIIQDNHTTGREYRRYSREVELVTGQLGIFPRAPIKTPCLKGYRRSLIRRRLVCRNRMKLAQYGNTSFFYRIRFKRPELERFKNYPRNKMWPLIEKAFRVPKGAWKTRKKQIGYAIRKSYATLLNIPLRHFSAHIHDGGKLYAAKRFYRRWKQLKKVNRPKKLAKAAAKLFSTSYYQREIIRILKGTSVGAKLPYYLTAKSSRIFGRISKQGDMLGNYEDALEKLYKLIDFDRINGGRINIDYAANVNRLRAKVIGNNKAIKIKFNLNRMPEFVFIQIESRRWFTTKNNTKLVIKNEGQFKLGDNEIVLKPSDAKGLGFKQILAKAIFKSNQKYKYRKKKFSIAISANNRVWGGVSATSFKMKK